MFFIMCFIICNINTSFSTKVCLLHSEKSLWEVGTHHVCVMDGEWFHYWCGPRWEWKKNAQRRRKHCTLAVVRRSQKNSPRRRPLPGVARRPKFNQLETNPVLWGSMHAISSYRGNRPTPTPHTHTHKQTGPQGRTLPQLACSVTTLGDFVTFWLIRGCALGPLENRGLSARR